MKDSAWFLEAPTELETDCPHSLRLKSAHSLRLKSASPLDPPSNALKSIHGQICWIIYVKTDRKSGDMPDVNGCLS